MMRMNSLTTVGRGRRFFDVPCVVGKLDTQASGTSIDELTIQCLLRFGCSAVFFE